VPLHQDLRERVDDVIVDVPAYEEKALNSDGGKVDGRDRRIPQI